MQIRKSSPIQASKTAKDTQYEKAIESIKCAVDCLGDVLQQDRSDKVARDSIANLGVVLLDLKK